MTVLTVTPPLRHVLNRCQGAITANPQVTTTDVLQFISDGYQRSCERVRLLHRTMTITVPAGGEAALPGETVEVFAVYQSGIKLRALAQSDAHRAIEGAYYYQRGSVVGLSVPSDQDTDLLVWYARRPDALVSLDDPLDPAFGWEWLYVLTAYVKYRIGLLAGGAQEASYTIAKRQEYERGIQELAVYARTFMEASPASVLAPMEVTLARG